MKEALSLYKVSEAIQASLNLEQVLATIGDGAIHELHAELVSTWLDDGEGSFVERQRIANYPGHDESSFGAFDPQAIKAHLDRDAVLLSHGQQSAPYFVKPPDILPSSLVIVPLRMRDRLVGWISPPRRACTSW